MRTPPHHAKPRAATLLLAIALPASTAAQDARSIDLALDRLEGATVPGAPFSCGTTDVMRVQAAWPDLDAQQSWRFRRVLGGPQGEGRGGEARGGVPCFYELSHSVESDHFSVQWGSYGGTDETAAQHLLDAAEAARQVYLDAGYAEPFGNPDVKVPFYLGNSGPDAPGIDFSGGYTTVCASYQHAYVVLSDIDVSNSTVDVGNHELFHTVQMGSPDPYSVDEFWWEATAVWAEDLSRPDLDIYAWFLPYYTNNTQLAMDLVGYDEIGFLHQYAMFILPTYIDEYSPGGPQALVDVWNGSGGGLIDRLESSWAGQQIDTSFDREFGGFGAAASVMDFEDQAIYSRIPPWEVIEPPATVEGETAPQRYGTHYYRVDPSEDDIDAGNTKILVHLDGGGPSWVLALNRSSDGSTALPTVVIADSDGQADAVGIDVGTLYSETWLAVSCTRQSCASYDLDVEVVLQTEDPGSDVDPPDDDGDGKRQGAGCKGIGVHPFSFRTGGVSLGLLAIPFLFRRRR